MAHDVFVSYSSKDRPAADAVVASLEQHEIRCFVAPRDIRPGADWGEAIVDAIESARVMVLVFSNHANASPQIKREVERAVAKGVVIVPLRIENVLPARSLEYFLSTPHWLDAYTPPLASYLDYLAATVTAILTNQPTPPPLKLAPWRRHRRAVPALLLVLAIGVAAVAFSASRDEPRHNINAVSDTTSTSLTTSSTSPSTTTTDAAVDERAQSGSGVDTNFTPLPPPLPPPPPPPPPATTVPQHWAFTLAANLGPPGFDTGVTLAPSSTVRIGATGQATYGYDTAYGGCPDGTPTTYPDGHRTLNGQTCSGRKDPQAIVKGQPIGYLLACIAQPDQSCDTRWFGIGAVRYFDVKIGGRLYLLFNDIAGQYGDNTGAYSVTIDVPGFA